MDGRRLTARDFERWIADPAADRSLAYHEGLLVADREADPDLAALADAALLASGALPPARRDHAGHSGQMVQGPAGPRLVFLTKRRTGEGRFLYVATKVPWRPRP
jgi:hypothetical protein